MEPNVTPERDDDPNPIPTAVLGLLGAVVVFLIVIVLETLYYSAAKQEDERKMVLPPVVDLSELRAAQQERLNGYRWLDASKGIVAVPIERAMELEAKRLEAERASAMPHETARPAAAPPEAEEPPSSPFELSGPGEAP